MTKETTRNAYMIICGMWVIAITCYIALFLLGIVLMEKTDLIFMVCCYYLFPVFSVVYGILSYKLTRRIFVPGLLYVLFSVFMGFLMIWTEAFASVLLDPHWDAAFTITPFWKNAIKAFPIFALITTFSIAASVFIAIVSSLLTMVVTKMLQKLRKGV